MRALFIALGAELARGAVYGGAISVCLIGDALIMRRELTGRLLAVFGIFSLAAALASLFAWPAAQILTARSPPHVRLAAILALLVAATSGLSAFLFFLQTRAYYAVYYPMEFTLEWLFHFAFTGAAAAYQVAVLGLRYFLPLGLIPLFAAAFFFAARPAGRL